MFVCSLATAAAVMGEANKAIPVVIELFTSEGCSSCPPADRLLAALDSEQPVPGAQLIVLSEHVDYWNTLGWIDPYSAHEFSERQKRYGDTLHVPDVYTPQAVIDGRFEVVGNSAPKLQDAIGRALKEKKIPLTLKASWSGETIHITLEAAEGAKHAQLYFALAEDAVQSKVSAGENSGHLLTHAAVVRSLTKAGKLDSENRLTIDLKTSARWGKHLRVIALLADHDAGKVLGAAVTQL
jgi:hypothetical protein